MAELRNFTKLLPLLISFGLIIGCSQPEVALSELVLRDGVYFKQFSDTPYNGKVIGSVVAELRDGRFHGQLLRYDENGNLSVRENYSYGTLHGPRETYLNGKKRRHMSFKNGFLHGPVVIPSRFADWEIERKAVFVDGFLHGPYVVGLDDRIFFETNFANHKVSSDHVDVFDEDGSIALSIPFEDGEIEGNVEWKNGCVQSFSGGIAGEMKSPPPNAEQIKEKAETGSDIDYVSMCWEIALMPIPQELINPKYVWGDAPSSY